MRFHSKLWHNLIALPFLLLLAGCFTGDEESYPHDSTKLVALLTSEYYFSVSGEGDRSDKKIHVVKRDDNSYVSLDDNGNRIVFGFYKNKQSDTYTFFYKSPDNPDDKVTIYFYIIASIKDDVITFYDFNEIHRNMLQGMIGRTPNLDETYSLPFKDSKLNQDLIEHLGKMDLSQVPIMMTWEPTD